MRIDSSGQVGIGVSIPDALLTLNTPNYTTSSTGGMIKWKNRLCLRTSAKVYNQSLIASMLFRLSEEETHKILSGWSNNLATKVFSSDTLALKAVQSGQCDATIVNSYIWAD